MSAKNAIDLYRIREGSKVHVETMGGETFVIERAGGSSMYRVTILAADEKIAKYCDRERTRWLFKVETTEPNPSNPHLFKPLYAGCVLRLAELGTFGFIETDVVTSVTVDGHDKSSLGLLALTVLAYKRRRATSVSLSQTA
jgi:hypothetical protein